MSKEKRDESVPNRTGEAALRKVWRLIRAASNMAPTDAGRDRIEEITVYAEVSDDESETTDYDERNRDANGREVYVGSGDES